MGLGILCLTGCYPQSTAGPGGKITRPVKVIQVRGEPANETLTLIGSIEPWQEAILYFEVSGIVAEVFVEEGDIVAPGDPIAGLVLDDYELGLSRAEAELAAAEAKLALLHAGTREEDLDVSRAAYSRAKVRAAYWTSELVRMTKLFRKNAISTSELEQTRRESDAAEQEELLRKAQLQKAVAGPRKEDIDAAAAEAEARRQAAALAARQLKKATLRAPFRGRVERRLLDAGAYVNVFPTGGVPVVHLVDRDQVDAVVAVPESLFSHFADEPQVEIISAVNTDIRAGGKIIALGQVADRASGTYQLRVRLDNPEGRFTSGMVVSAEVKVESTRQAIRIPVSSLRQAYGQSPQVLLVDPEANQVIAREVQLGPIAGERVEITAGLSGDELLIVRGQDRVIAGLRSQQQEADQRYDTMQSELREVKLNGLPPEQQTRLREQWTSDDQTTKLDAYKNELEQYHLELDDFRLISTYGQFGVTEEILTQVPADERESFCESVRADYWEEQAQQQPAANQQPPPQQQPTAPVPAGASAPSDTGGNPLPSKPDEPNSSKGQGAMADNISRSDSWERTAFPAHRS